jgi:putative phosphoesterase
VKRIAKKHRVTKIGIISDTHGLLRPEAVAELRGVELIIHAGDVGGYAGEDGKAEILRALEEVAPVVAVRGNVDTEDWGRKLREREIVEVEAQIRRQEAGSAENSVSHRRGAEYAERAQRIAEPSLIYVLHSLRELDLDPAAVGFQMVVSGHTHEAMVEEKGGVIYLNPGSAGPRRFKLPVTVARVDLGVRPWGIEIVDLGKGKE